MSKSRKILSSVLASVLMFSLMSVGLSGCFGGGSKPNITLESPAVQSPDIIESGVLRVGVDSEHAPFAGLSGSKIIGIDVDIAAGVAEKLGLKLQLFDVKGQDINNLLKDGTIDVVMGIQGEKATNFSESQVGPYLVDGPAVFTVGHSDVPTTLDPTKLTGVKIAAQEKSLSAYQISQQYGDSNLVTFPKLEEVFTQLKSGAISYAAADAIVGSFLAVKQENIRCEGILGTPQGVFMGVAANKQNLVSKLTEALRSLRDGGNMQVIVAKWLGPVSSQAVLSTDAIVSQNSATGATNSGTTGNATTPPAEGTTGTPETGATPPAEGGTGDAAGTTGTAGATTPQ
jgi:polar amino acid transport system substrate-binding protein